MFILYTTQISATTMAETETYRRVRHWPHKKTQELVNSDTQIPPYIGTEALIIPDYTSKQLIIPSSHSWQQNELKKTSSIIIPPRDKHTLNFGVYSSRLVLLSHMHTDIQQKHLPIIYHRIKNHKFIKVLLHILFKKIRLYPFYTYIKYP